MNFKWGPRYQKILNEIEEEVKDHPEYVDLHNQLGIIFLIQGEKKRAQNHFKEALRLNPKYWEPLLHLGYFYLGTKKFNELKKSLMKEGKGEEKEGLLHLLLALSYLKNNKEREVLFQVQKILYFERKRLGKSLRALGRGRIECNEKLKFLLETLYSHYLLSQFHRLMAFRLSQKGRLKEAVQEIQRAYQIRPDAFIFHSSLGRIYFEAGIYGKAIRHYQKAIKIYPRDGLSCAHLSFIYGIRRKTQDALKWMEETVRLKPTYADLHYNLALLHSDRKQYDEVISELKKAIRINPNYLFTRINLGVLYEEQRRIKEARREYRRVLRITPEDKYVRDRLKKISS